MPPQLEDYAEQFLRDQEKGQQFLRDQLRHQQRVGEVLSELQADPKWATYGNHLAAIKETWEGKLKAAERRLLTAPYLSPEQYAEAKVEQKTAQAWVDALDLALNLARTLIERGEAAAVELLKGA